MVLIHLVVMQMSRFSMRLALALLLAALCLGGRTAHAQADPVRYWISGWPIGFGGGLGGGQGASSYGNFPGFQAGDAGNGGLYNFPKGWFVSGESGTMSLGMNGFSQDSAFGSLRYEGAQFGYNFQNTPLKVFGGFDTLKYDSGLGTPFSSIDALSGTRTGYSAHGGVAFQPAPNVSLSVGFGYTQQSGRIDSDTPSPSLSTESPYALVGHK
jgi:opacity protein-like surface antigen